METPGQQFAVNQDYRYGYNGKEKDKDFLNNYDYGFRIYNPTIAKFLSVDPLTKSYPWYTPYQFAGNKPIKFIDLDGAEELDVNTYVWNQLIILNNYLFGYNPKRQEDGRVVVDDNSSAITHYYRGNGTNVVLGDKTVEAIKNSEDVQKYRNNIESGKTPAPAKNEGQLPVGMTFEDSNTFHLGATVLKYSTICNSEECTTTYTVDAQGFTDPNVVFEYLNKGLQWINLGKDSWIPDGHGTNLEAHGDPYDYAPVQWSETYKNPGYKVDDKGNPLPMVDKNRKPLPVVEISTEDASKTK